MQRLGALTAATLGVAAIFSIPLLASAAECPGGADLDGSVGGVLCEDPSPSPSPTTSRRPSSSPSPRPTGTRTSSPPPSTRPSSTRPSSQPTPISTIGFPSGFPTTFPSGFPTSFPSGFPTSLPTGLPTTSEQDPFGYGERTELPQFTQPTGPGLAAAPGETSDAGPAVRILAMLVGAGTIAFLLVRARVRRWMIGI